tara:strand:+ start:322 stop:897 length:576 start_codon:yes stop_codon:yes gene_type:complete
MKRIAIVGNIGSGKSFVAKNFKFPIFDADREVDRIYKKNKFCFRKLKKALPKYIHSFPVNKINIANAILKNSKNLKKIINIIHPEVRRKMNLFLKKNNNRKIVILDIPLFLENKLNKKNDILIFVDASKKEIYKRLKQRKNFNLKLFKILLKFQLPLEIKKKKSQYIIKNNFTKKPLKNNIIKILKKIKND